MKRIRLLSACAVATAMLCAPPASSAMPFTDIRADDLFRSEGELKKSLHLNANQQLLWEQTVAKTRTLLRTRQARHEQLQGTLKLALANNGAELREVAAKIDAESDADRQEERQLREFWLTVNDALDDAQRQVVLQFLADQLDRMPGPDREPSRERPGEGGHLSMRGGMGGGMGRP